MTPILTDFSETALITAIEANLFEMLPTLYTNLPNSVYKDEPDAALFMCDIAFPLFNGVIRARFAPEHLGTRIPEIIGVFKSANKPMVWWTGPSTQPQDLGHQLTTHGLLHLDDSSGMAIDLQAVNNELPSNPAVTVKKVQHIDELKQWVAPFVANFELPKKSIPQLCEAIAQLGFDEQGTLHHYLGLLNGDVVGTASLYLGAGVAGIYNVSTLPPARRQGVGTALVHSLLHLARARGYRIGILHATELGHNVYRRIGFTDLCTISHYVYLPKRLQRTFLQLYLWASSFLKTRK